MASTTLENPTSLTTQSFAVDGMTCGGCATGVQRALSRLNGVSGATVDLASATATVAYDAATVRPADLRAAVAEAGYTLREQGTAPAVAPRAKGGSCCG